MKKQQIWGNLAAVNLSKISALVLEWRLLLKAIPAALTISRSPSDYGNSYYSRVVILVLYGSRSPSLSVFLS